VTCERWEVVIVPFPFVEREGVKRRPAVVVSNREFNRAGHSILAMVTSSEHTPWPGDSRLEDFESAGLRAPCLVRLKVFTLDNRFILRRAGRLSPSDSEKVGRGLLAYLTS
jgi:mRNA interferase MazF